MRSEERAETKMNDARFKPFSIIRKPSRAFFGEAKRGRRKSSHASL